MIKYPEGKSRRPRALTSSREITSSVRRMSHVVSTFHQVVMNALIALELEGTAEEFNDYIKPVIDYMRGFELEEDTDVSP